MSGETAVILAGGLGTRISEETDVKPKPMVEVGGKPILWHIMKIYFHQGVRNFVVLGGYKFGVMVDYFLNYASRSATKVTVSGKDGKAELTMSADSEDWVVTLVDTGIGTSTGGRLARVESLIGAQDDFFFTYGDGVADVDVRGSQRALRETSTVASLTAVLPQSRYGSLSFGTDMSPSSDAKIVRGFQEKPLAGDGYVNGGFMTLSREVFDLLDGDDSNFESDVLPILASQGRLSSYVHNGFWRSMDTLRDKRVLEDLWSSKQAPWRTW